MSGCTELTCPYHGPENRRRREIERVWRFDLTTTDEPVYFTGTTEAAEDEADRLDAAGLYAGHYPVIP